MHWAISPCRRRGTALPSPWFVWLLKRVAVATLSERAPDRSPFGRSGEMAPVFVLWRFPNRKTVASCPGNALACPKTKPCPVAGAIAAFDVCMVRGRFVRGTTQPSEKLGSAVAISDIARRVAGVNRPRCQVAERDATRPEHCALSDGQVGLVIDSLTSIASWSSCSRNSLSNLARAAPL